MRITGGTLRGQLVDAPKGLDTRPTSSRLREAFFNICQQHVSGAHFLDLYAGSGIMALEAMSRGAETAVIIDKAPAAVAIIKKNLQVLHLDAQVIQGEVLKVLARLSERSFTLIYADPPYRLEEEYKQLIQAIDQGDLLASGGQFFVEMGKEMEIPLTDLSLVKMRKYGNNVLAHYKRKGFLTACQNLYLSDTIYPNE